jgi:competence protein ComEC
MGWGCEAVLAIARLVAAWPGAALPLRPIPAEGLLVASFGFLLLCLWRGWGRLLGVPVMAAGLAAGLVIRPPDLLIAGDGRVILLHAGDQAFLLRGSGGSAFVRDAYLRAYGLAEAAPLPTSGDGPALTCGPDACRYAPYPGVALALIRSGATAGYCGQAAVLVSPEPLRPRCHAGQAVDRFSVWREGPHAVWLRPDGAVVLSDRGYRGDRPWVPPPPLPRQRGEVLPPAPVE